MYDAYILDLDTCGYDAHICMMHLSMTLDPDTCMYDAFINFPRSLTLMHVCMVHISMVLDLDSYICVYDAYIYGFGP